MKRTDVETRVKAFNLFNELKENGISRKEVVYKIVNKFSLPPSTVYEWWRNKFSSFGKGLEYRKELFYVLGALLGDGSIYHWKKARIGRRTINLVGEK